MFGNRTQPLHKYHSCRKKAKENADAIELQREGGSSSSKLGEMSNRARVQVREAVRSFFLGGVPEVAGLINLC